MERRIITTEVTEEEKRPSRTKVIKIGTPHSTPSVPQPMVIVLTVSPLFVVSRTPLGIALMISFA